MVNAFKILTPTSEEKTQLERKRERDVDGKIIT
jgi:hypothetical protein